MKEMNTLDFAITDLITYADNNNECHMTAVVYVSTDQESHLQLRAGGRSISIKKNNILLVHAHSNYSNIYTTDGSRYFTSRTLKHWADKLKSEDLIRVHASYLVNKNCIVSHKKYLYQMQLTNGMLVRVSRKYHVD
jgi:DNA-binding LytR/AlgR family response regulator